MTEAPTPFAIGLDGGGSGCRVAICDASGAILGRGEGGPANATTDFDGTVRHLCAALDIACVGAGVTLADLAEVPAHAGLAGVISAEVGDRVAAALPLRRVTVTEDSDTMLAGALGRQDGALAAIGTGSFFARQAGGVSRSVGGWGFQLSDQASGAWLGHELMKLALHVSDGLVAESPLARAVLDEIGGPPGLVAFGRRAFAHDYAAYAPRIVEAAKAGDSAGLSLMWQGATFLRFALDGLGHRAGEPLCLTGGVGVHYAPYLDDLTLIAPKGSALDGALALARRIPA